MLLSKYRMVFIVFVLSLQVVIFSEEFQYKYSKYTPYFSEEMRNDYFIEDPTIKIIYNIWMHNYDDALYQFKELDGNKIEDYSIFESNIVDILEILFLQKKYKELFFEIENWINLRNQWKDNNNSARVEIVRLYYNFKINNINLTDSLDNYSNFCETTFKNNLTDINKNQMETINYLALCYSESNGNDSLAIKLLEKSINGYYDKKSTLLKTRILANTDVAEAIEFLNDQLNYFFENEYDQPMMSYANHIEELRMFLAYLYYKVDDIEKSLENLKLAVSSKENGSTFMGDWDYWLNYREYYEDEYEVLLELKQIILKN